MLATAPPATAVQGTGRRVAVLLLAFAAGSALYAVAVSLLALWPVAVRARGAGGPARPALVAAFAVPVAVAGAVLLFADRGPAPRRALAIVCVGLGAAWTAWGLLEQHVLRSFDLAPRSSAAGVWDALFHAVGLVTAGVGTSLLSAGRGFSEAT